MQKFLAGAALIGGIVLLFNAFFVIGVMLLIAGALVFNGARHDAFYSSDFSDWGSSSNSNGDSSSDWSSSDSGSDSGGGGDGGGGGD
jgi:uncharacterized membrane protein YgcG